MKKQGETRSRRTRATAEGREKLLNSARVLFRSKVRHEVSRLEIARHAGVAPALLSYYFATKADLVLAVTRPVLDDAIAKLLATIDAPLSPQERLKQSAILFIDFARINGPLLDLFVEAVSESGDEGGQALIHTCIDKLGLFFSEAVQADLIAKDTDPILLLLAMWGMCRLVGEMPPLPLRNVRPEAGLDERTATEAAFIIRLILQGAKPTSTFP